MDKKINVKLSEPFSLVSPSYNEDFNVVTRYQVVMTYKLKVNTVEPPLAAGVNSLLQKNTVRVFFTNNPSELYYASATNDNVAYNKILDAYTTDLDQDPTTLSHLNASVNATILNDQSYFATMSKTVNIPIYNIDVHEDGRTYEIKIVNTGSTDFTIDHFVDLLPKYETLVTGSLEVIDATGVSVSPNVNVDKYTDSNGDKFERLTVSSPVTVYSAITSNVTHPQPLFDTKHMLIRIWS